MQPVTIAAHAHITDLLASWKSKFSYIVEFSSVSKQAVFFLTTWSRHPTPHQPLPTIRVEINFIVKYGKKDIEFKIPDISFRMEGHEYVHKKMKNVDNLLVAMFKHKSQFFERNSIYVENESYYKTRFEYAPVPEVGQIAVDFSNPEKSNPNGRDMEAKIISHFLKHDVDKDLKLDARELTFLLSESEVGKLLIELQLVPTLIACFDTDKDQCLSYREFLPMGIDLLHGSSARSHASQIMLNLTAETKEAAERRVRSSCGLAVSVDHDLVKLDPDQTGQVAIDQMVHFLATLDIELSEEECDSVVQLLDVSAEGFVELAGFRLNHAAILANAVQQSALESQCSKRTKGMSDSLVKLFEEWLRENGGHWQLDGALGLLKNRFPHLSEVALVSLMAWAPRGQPLAYVPFARHCALALDALAEPRLMQERLKVLERAEVDPVELLSEAGKQRIARLMRGRFDEFDSACAGSLSVTDFRQIVNDTNLALSTETIDTLHRQVDTNNDGQIRCESSPAFSKFSPSL
jgi:Ca2+-binding EF-hand superfamily protein